MIGIIYRIDIGTDFFIGYTTKTLALTKALYNQQLKKGLETLLYKTMRERGLDFYTVSYTVISKCEYETVLELRRAKGDVQKLLKPTLNSRISGRTSKEIYEQDKDKILAQQKEYQKRVGRAVVGIKQKEYYQRNKEKVAAYQKEYNTKHKEKYIEYQKQYRMKKKLLKLILSLRKL